MRPATRPSNVCIAAARWRNSRLRRPCGRRMSYSLAATPQRRGGSHEPANPSCPIWGLRGLFDQLDEFPRVGTLDIVVAFHNDDGPAEGLGATVKRIKVVLFRRPALVHGQDAGRRQLSGGGLVGEGDGLAEGSGRP